MLICSLWTASIQKLPPSQGKRLKCDRFPLGLCHGNKSTGKAGWLVWDTVCHLPGPTSAFIWGAQDAFPREGMCHFSKTRSLLPEIGCYLSLISPRAFGIRNILRDPVWRRFEFNLTAGSRGTGIPSGF